MQKKFEELIITAANALDAIAASDEFMEILSSGFWDEPKTSLWDAREMLEALQRLHVHRFSYICAIGCRCSEETAKMIPLMLESDQDFFESSIAKGMSRWICGDWLVRTGYFKVVTDFQLTIKGEIIFDWDSKKSDSLFLSLDSVKV